MFGFVKKNLSGAKRRMDAASGEKGCGERGAALVPASALENWSAMSAPTQRGFFTYGPATSGGRSAQCPGTVRVNPVSNMVYGHE